MGRMWIKKKDISGVFLLDKSRQNRTLRFLFCEKNVAKFFDQERIHDRVNLRGKKKYYVNFFVIYAVRRITFSYFSMTRSY